MKYTSHRIMISLYLMNIIAFLFYLSDCTHWDNNKVIHGVEFSKIRYETKNDDTLLIIGYLTTDKIIEEYPCAEDYVHFTKDWRIKLFRLSDKSIINNYNYAKDTWIKFDNEHNVICVFPKDTYVQGYLCKGYGGAKGISTLFYKNGKLHCFCSANDALIGEIFCLCGALNNIELYENGNLKECTLASDKEINGILYNKYSRILFDTNGKIRTTWH